MAITAIMGLETRTPNESAYITGTTTVATTYGRRGGYGARANPALSGQVLYDCYYGTAARGYVNFATSATFYLYVVAYPSFERPIIEVGSGTGQRSVMMDTVGHLAVSTSATMTAGTYSTSTLALNQWYQIGFDQAYNGATGRRVFVDGVEWAGDASLTASGPGSDFVYGMINGTGTGEVWFDDFIVYDGALPAGFATYEYKVDLLTPASDSAKGSWTDAGGGTTNIYTNLSPPINGTLTTGFISSIANSATDNYDAVCGTYASIGITDSAQIIGIQAICFDAQTTTTGSPKLGAIAVTANPSGQTEKGFDFGIPNGSAASETAAAAGTAPAGWGVHYGPVTAAPTVTATSGPTVRVGKRTATTQKVCVDLLGVYVAQTVRPRVQTKSYYNAAVHRAATW